MKTLPKPDFDYGQHLIYLLLLFVVAPIKTNPYLIILIRSLYVVATSNAMRLPTPTISSL